MLMKKIKHHYHTKGFNKIVLLLLAGLVIGFIIGLGIGIEITINKVAKIASGFIDIDENLIRNAIFQYENNIGSCYPSNSTP